MSLLAGHFSAPFLRLFGRWRGALLGIGLYTLLVRAGASVVRAAIMAGLSLFAKQVGRRQDSLNSLALVAALMALFQPGVLWDVGFQLSFNAKLGLMFYAQPLADWFERLKVHHFASNRASCWSPCSPTRPTCPSSLRL
jgi:ComEC/Rec2-related protein